MDGCSCRVVQKKHAHVAQMRWAAEAWCDPCEWLWPLKTNTEEVPG